VAARESDRSVAIELDHVAAVVDHVQHQSAAARPPIADRTRPLEPSSTPQKTFSDPAATSYGSNSSIGTGDVWRPDSHRTH